MIHIIRPPQLSKYNDLDLRECHLVSYFLGYCEAQQILFDYKVHDFVLDSDKSMSDITKNKDKDTYVIFTRDSGANPHYTVRMVKLITSFGGKVIVYGKVGRYKYFDIFCYNNVTFVEHNEESLARELFPNAKIDKDVNFTNKIYCKPYFDKCQMNEERKYLFKACLETTRGCEFSCSFCYITETLGENSFQTRRPEDTIRDISAYYEKGVRHFVFMDSEFIGLSKKRKDDIHRLIELIIANFPDIKYTIYSRADTLSKFNAIPELKRSGLVNVFIGVESFHEEDLIEMNKGVRAKRLIKSIEDLMEHEIYMTLSFIIFNRNASNESIEANINALRELYSNSKKQFLGMPFYLFSIECALNGDVQYKLSNKTYIRWILHYREQPNYEMSIFDSSLEYLMEIYRIASYEIARKTSEINPLLEKKPNLNVYFDVIPNFAIEIMDIFLAKNKLGLLTEDSLMDNVKQLYEYFSHLYEQVFEDEELQTILTKERTIKLLSEPLVPYVDHGWDEQIPPIKEAI